MKWPFNPSNLKTSIYNISWSTTTLAYCHQPLIIRTILKTNISHFIDVFNKHLSDNQKNNLCTLDSIC